MKLVAGLGNLGRNYENTRHNLGFMVLDQLASRNGLEFSTNDRFKADVAELTIDGQKTVLAKPRTMMNLSGQSLQQLMHFYKLAQEDVLVVHDELDLPFGQLRIRQGGRSAGNRGIESVIHQVGDSVWRFRLGIASEQLNEMEPDRFVLSQFQPEERRQLHRLVEEASRTVEDLIRHGQPSHDTLRLI